MINDLSIERVLIVALLSAVCVLSVVTCNNRGRELDQYKTVVQLQHDTIVQWKDSQQRTHAVKSVEVASMEVLKAFHKKELDSLTTIIGIKDKNIEAVIMASTKSQGYAIPKIDTVYLPSGNTQYGFNYSDKWLDAEYILGDTLKYRVRDSLAFTHYWKNKVLKLDVFSMNPNTTITGVTSLQIPAPRPKKWHAGPYIGYGWSNGWKLTAGVAISYGLISF